MDLVGAPDGQHDDRIGLLVVAFSPALRRARDGCLLYVTERGLAHLLVTMRGYAAITFGHVIISAREPSDALWLHERRHVEQYDRLGLAFIPLYLWFMLRRGYRGHPLERDASGPPTPPASVRQPPY